MKKVILFVAFATLMSATITSCGKSTKGKMDGEWKIDSYTETTSSTNGSTTNTSTFTIDGTTITNTNTNGGSSSTETGTVSTAEWNIKKDGTWERTLVFTIAGTGYTSTQTVKSSGNWDFESGTGEYKKNERVVFSTLSESATQVNTSGSISTTSTSSDTYLDGEHTDIFVITESKKKSLALEKKQSNTNTSTGSNTTTSTSNATAKLSL